MSPQVAHRKKLRKCCFAFQGGGSVCSRLNVASDSMSRSPSRRTNASGVTGRLSGCGVRPNSSSSCSGPHPAVVASCCQVSRRLSVSIKVWPVGWRGSLAARRVARTDQGAPARFRSRSAASKTGAKSGAVSRRSRSNPHGRSPLDTEQPAEFLAQRSLEDDTSGALRAVETGRIEGAPPSVGTDRPWCWRRGHASATAGHRPGWCDAGTGQQRTLRRVGVGFPSRSDGRVWLVAGWCHGGRGRLRVQATRLPARPPPLKPRLRHPGRAGHQARTRPRPIWGRRR